MGDKKSSDLSGADKVKSDELRLLAFKPRSVAELVDRLKKKKHSADLIDQVVESLTRQGLLNDSKFAELYANAAVSSRPVSKKRLEMDLIRKGLSPKETKEALQKVEGYDEKKAARDLVWSRFQRMSGIPNQKKKARLFGFLKRRGFSNDIVFSVLSDLIKDDESADF